MTHKWIKLVGFMVVGFFASSTAVMAAAQVYGEVHFKTYYSYHSKEHTLVGDRPEVMAQWGYGAETHLGVNFKQGNITGKWEIAHIPDERNSFGIVRGGMVSQEAWGQWDFGSGQLLIGHTLPLTDYVVAEGLMLHDMGLQNMGGTGYDTDTGRVSQIRLTYGNFSMALITPFTKVDVLDNTDAVALSGVRAVVPKLEARYNWASQYVNISAFGGIQVYEATDSAPGGTSTISKSLMAWLVGLAGEVNYNAFTFRAGVNYRVNGANYGLVSDMRETAYLEGGSIKNTWAIGVVAAVGYRFSDRLYTEAGGSYIHTRSNLSSNTKDNGYALYISNKYTLAPGVYVHPEVAFYDYGRTRFMGASENMGRALYGGISWVIEF